ncbi:MAG TPA: DUF202 domain-containing protein [Drouetiella sp.]
MSDPNPSMPVDQSSANKLKHDTAQVNAHLANERTFLAWIRTGVSMMGFGVLIAKLRYMGAGDGPKIHDGLSNASNIGVLFAMIGIATIVMSIVFFLTTQRQIRNNDYSAGKRFVLILALLSGVLGLIILWDLQTH